MLACSLPSLLRQKLGQGDAGVPVGASHERYPLRRGDWNVTPGGQPQQACDIIAPFFEAGAMWWVKFLGPIRGALAANREWIQQGPPDLVRNAVAREGAAQPA